jgi:hypothetical protein
METVEGNACGGAIAHPSQLTRPSQCAPRRLPRASAFPARGNRAADPFDRHGDTSLMTHASALLRSAVLVATLSLASLASAQTPPPHGHPGAPPLAAILLDDVLHASLGLSAGQEALWLALDTDDANLQAQMKASHDAVQSLVTTELANTTPDVVLIETARAAARDADIAAAQQLDSDALALYANLDATQQATVIGAFKAAYQDHRADGHGPPPGPPRGRH